jgi:hypothetical protein
MVNEPRILYDDVMRTIQMANRNDGEHGARFARSSMVRRRE